MYTNNSPSGLNVLVIDDEYLNTFICEKLIKKVVGEAEVTVCLSGKYALDKLLEIKNEDPDLLPDYIFLDISMPGMSAWEFLDQYINLDIDPLGKCKIYILTSSLLFNDRMKSASYDVVKEYITKPLDFEKLNKIFATSINLSFKIEVF